MIKISFQFDALAAHVIVLRLIVFFQWWATTWNILISGSCPSLEEHNQSKNNDVGCQCIKLARKLKDYLEEADASAVFWDNRDSSVTWCVFSSFSRHLRFRFASLETLQRIKQYYCRQPNSWNNKIANNKCKPTLAYLILCCAKRKQVYLHYNYPYYKYFQLFIPSAKRHSCR